MSVRKKFLSNPHKSHCSGLAPGAVSRRDFLCRSYNGLGALALAGMLAEELGANPAEALGPMAVRTPDFPRKAKHCIFMFMAGGASQVDTFDYKPALEEYAGKQLPKLSGFSGEIQGYLEQPHRAMPSRWEFKRYGESGKWVSTLFPHIAECVDDLAFIYGIKVDNNNHGPATFHANTGSVFPGSPSVGSWVTYGLGSPNQNLPGYVVIQDPRGATINGADNWGCAYLPAAYQGTLIRAAGTPILDLDLPPGLTREGARRQFDLLRSLNEQHRDERRRTSELEARISAYELAYRMQMEAPEAVDLSKESEQTKKMYGLDNPMTDGFGRQCLLARRMVERGVRYTMLIHGGGAVERIWDDHTNTFKRMPEHAAEVDQAVGALLKDLKGRGLLDETLVVWASEMGRTTFINDVDTDWDKLGRDHNQYGLVMWMAGGDVKGATSVGQTDEFGLGPIGDNPIHMRDVHATILNLLGLHDEKLTYLHAGRFRRLTDIGGRALTEIMAV